MCVCVEKHSWSVLVGKRMAVHKVGRGSSRVEGLLLPEKGIRTNL